MFNAERLQQLRKEKQWTLKQVSETTGVSISYISNLEKGRVQNPSYEVVEALANLFRVSRDDLMSTDGAKSKEPESTIDMMTLRKLRMSKGWSLQTVAEISGVHSSTLSLIENGKVSAATMKTLTNLAKAYEVEVEDLVLRRESYVDLTTLVMQSDTVVIDGEEIDVTNHEDMEKLLIALQMGAAWVKTSRKNKVDVEDSG